MNERPDIIVSVDLGTTFTGVAWMTPRTPIQVINDWPGSGDRGERKVPTTLIYNDDGTISSWGFMCADDDDALEKTRREYFKIFLDDETLELARSQGLSNAPQSTAEAQKYVTDYLREVYKHVKETIEIQTGRQFSGGWTDLAVEFMFSVPTTWRNQDIINTYKTVIQNSGFGGEGPRHVAHIDLTEAEAAAVATLKQSPVQFYVGSLFLTVDAGGGTTDLSLMQVTSTDDAFPQMAQIAEVKGVGVGASLIDRGFMKLVKQRFDQFPEIKAMLPSDYHQRMARSHNFLTVKHKFGLRAYMQQHYRIAMEGVAADFSHPGLGIENGKMVFSLQEIQGLFEPQVEGIKRKIKEQLDWLSDNHQVQQVQYMVLSGGLGSSAYIRERLQQDCMQFPHPNANQVAVIPCQDPQLVVVRGLLLDRQQKMETGNVSVLASRVARASYGVVVQELYSPQLHFNEEVRKDAFNSGQMWAVNQIQWLIKKGEIINPNQPLVKSFEIRLGPQDTTRSWDSEIVISHSEPQFLPKSLRQGGAAKLCEVKSNLQGLQQHQLVLREKRGSCWSRGYTFYICQFDVRVIVAPADLRFELWFGGQKFSGNHEPISVTWDQKGTGMKGM